MAESIWPYDNLIDPTVDVRASPHDIRCFVLLRSAPKDVWDDLFALIQSVASQVRSGLPINRFEVKRAIDIVSPGVIHHEIWREIKQADIVIADVTGHNPNVMFELGVAAAAKPKQRVILLREGSSEAEPFPFDTMPARHIVYQRTSRGYNELAQRLYESLLQALAAAPFEEIRIPTPSLPFEAKLDDGHDNPRIWTSHPAHRRMRDDCMEFGSLYVFPYSFASVADVMVRNVRVEADMKLLLKGQCEARDVWLGVSVRNQGFHVNFGYLLHVRSDGSVAITLPKDERGDMTARELGVVAPPGEGAGANFLHFEVSFGEENLSVRVDDVTETLPVAQLPHVFSGGRILFQAHCARVGLRSVVVAKLAD